MVRVGHSDTGVVEDTNSGINLLSRGTSNTGKQVSWDNITERVSKRFKLDAYKLYLDSFATNHSSFVRWMLGNMHQASTLIQSNCYVGVSTSDKKYFWPVGSLAQ